jgi:hypothetical protein
MCRCHCVIAVWNGSSILQQWGVEELAATITGSQPIHVREYMKYIVGFGVLIAVVIKGKKK